MRRLNLLLILSAIVIASSSIARADDISLFNLNSVVIGPAGADGATYTESGTISIDVTTGAIVADAITLLSTTSSTTTTHVYDTGLYTSNPDIDYPTFTIYFLAGSNSNEFISLALPVTSLIGYTGGQICGVLVFSSNCYAGSGFFIYNPVFWPYDGGQEPVSITSGSLTTNTPGTPTTPTSATPEPSSLILLSTGALGLLTTARRRVIKA